MLTKKVEYGYIILKKLNESGECKLMSGKEILMSTNVPYSMGLGILTQLSKNGLVKSLKGKSGGFYLKKNRITMLELCLALEKNLQNDAIYKDYADLNYREIVLKIERCLSKELQNTNIIPLMK